MLADSQAELAYCAEPRWSDEAPGSPFKAFNFSSTSVRTPISARLSTLVSWSLGPPVGRGSHSTLVVRFIYEVFVLETIAGKSKSAVHVRNRSDLFPALLVTTVSLRMT